MVDEALIVEQLRSRFESNDAKGFLGPTALIGDQIAFPIADVSNSLGQGEVLFALRSVSSARLRPVMLRTT